METLPNNSKPEETIQIFETSEEIFKRAEFYLDYLKLILPDLHIFLIGSLAIPVCIKNEIDILVEIEESDDIKNVQEKIVNKNPDLFRIGPIGDGEGYLRSKKKHGIICEIHILRKGDKKMDRYLKQIERFKSDPDLTKRYGDLKRSLNGVTVSEYKKAKNRFFEENGLV